MGVATVGAIPAGFPAPRLPAVAPNELALLVEGAGTLVLVSFCSMMTTARGFAAKNGYAIDGNRDFVALGVADLASGLTGGFAVSGADSRTAVVDAAGGKTQVTSLVAAAVMAAALVFFTGPLAALPSAALAAILVSSAIGLFDVGSLRTYWRVSPAEFRHSVVAMLGVMTVGILAGILVAVAMALLRLLVLASRPHDVVMGVVEGKDGSFEVTDEPGAEPVPGLIIYRFDAALLFFNAERFQTRVRELVAAAEPKPRWVLYNAESATLLDLTGAQALEAVRAELAAQGITLAVARAKGLFAAMLERTGETARIGEAHLFPGLRAGVEAFRNQRP
jgi:MFS superfamily sulfate permease-like transporter